MRVGQSFTLHERTITLGGYEYDRDGVRVVVLPRRIRIREFTDAQIELRMLIAFAVGFAFAMLSTLATWFFHTATIN